MDALTYLAAGMVDRHDGDLMLETAIVKLFCSEASWQIADDALQIFGGEGYIRENGVERMLRDSRINRIVEGATEVMTSFVALVGMKGVGEEFEQVLRASRHPIDNFGRLAKFAQTQWSDVVMGSGAKPGRDGRLHRELQEEGRLLSNLTVRLARSVHKLLRTYRQDVLDMQLLQERIAWSAADLFAISAVISKLQSMLEAHDKSQGQNGSGNGNGNGNGHNGNGQMDSTQRDVLIGKSFCRRAGARIAERLDSLFDNLDRDLLAVADAVLAKE
jgi:alkylation response protein AidB-like acyl-CoA dehydrogenase